MNMEFQDKKKLGPKRFIHSFYYAFCGLISTLKTEQNMVVHVISALLVIFAGFLFQISYIEWIICFILIGLIMSAELINTALETVVDLVSPEIHPLAKIAKDTAAAAVLVLSIFAFLSGVLIFGPKVMAWIL